MNEPIKCEKWLDALSMSLARMYAMPINFYLWLLEGEACHISGGCINTYLRNPICSTHSLACKIFSHQTGLVNISASWSLVPTLSMQMSPFCWSLMKWWRTSICFVLECWTGLLVSFMALSLSHSNDTCLNLIPKSFKVVFIESNWAQQLSAKMYSASMVESATLFCFFDDQDTSDFSNNWHVPDVLSLNFASCIIEVWISNQLKSCSFGIPQSNILCMLQVPQYSFGCLQMALSWWDLKSSTYAYTKHHIQPWCGHIE